MLTKLPKTMVYTKVFVLYTTQKKYRITYYIMFVFDILKPFPYFESDGICMKLSQNHQWVCGSTSTNFQDDLTVI